MRSKDNIADLGTRENATAADVHEDSWWQKGPDWIYLKLNQWPVDQDVGRCIIPEEFLIRHKLIASIDLNKITINYESLKGKSFRFVQNVTARVIRIFRNKSFKGNLITKEDRDNAEVFMLKYAMILTKKMNSEGKLASLRPEVKSDGII